MSMVALAFIVLDFSELNLPFSGKNLKNGGTFR